MIPGTLRTWTKSNSYNLLLEAKPLQTYWETISYYLVKLNIHIPGPSNSLLRVIHRRDLHRKTGTRKSVVMLFFMVRKGDNFANRIVPNSKNG